jgi:hypothetical protein
MTAVPNVRGEAVFLRAENYALTAREIVYALAAHLTYFGDTLTVRVVDPWPRSTRTCGSAAT